MCWYIVFIAFLHCKAHIFQLAYVPVIWCDALLSCAVIIRKVSFDGCSKVKPQLEIMTKSTIRCIFFSDFGYTILVDTSGHRVLIVVLLKVTIAFCIAIAEICSNLWLFLFNGLSSDESCNPPSHPSLVCAISLIPFTALISFSIIQSINLILLVLVVLERIPMKYVTDTVSMG